MPNFFVIDAKGQRHGPFNDHQLKLLAARGKITPMTSLETESGYQGQAGQIPGLFPENTTVVPGKKSLVSKPMLAAVVVLLVVAAIWFMWPDKDRAIAKKDLREISDYIAKDTGEYLFSGLISTDTNLKKDIHSRGAENFERWKKAADRGIPEGQTLLGICYLAGIGVNKDEKKGTDWIRKAAERGNPVAQYKFAEIHLHVDNKKAAEWMRKSANQGYAEAQFGLARFYTYGGIGDIPRDDKEAVKWIRKAASQGCFRAQYALTACHLFGKGVDINYKEAAKWAQKVEEQKKLTGLLKETELHLDAERGEANAQFELGDRYLKSANYGGYGISAVGMSFHLSSDDTRTMATKWLNEAKEKGHKEAEELLQPRRGPRGW